MIAARRLDMTEAAICTHATILEQMQDAIKTTYGILEAHIKACFVLLYLTPVRVVGRPPLPG